MPAIVFLILRIAAAIILLAFLGSVLLALLKDLRRADPASPCENEREAYPGEK